MMHTYIILDPDTCVYDACIHDAQIWYAWTNLDPDIYMIHVCTMHILDHTAYVHDVYV